MEIFQEFKIIWEYLEKYKKEVKFTAVLALAGAILSAIIPYIYGKLVDIISLEFFSWNFVLALLGIWLLTSTSSAFIDKITFQRRSFLGMDVSNDLTCQSAEHIISLPLKFHREEKIGEIFSKIDRASLYISRIIEDIVFLILPQFLTVFVGILILFFVDWRLSSAAFVLLLGYILITIYKTAPIVEGQEKINKAFERAYGNLYDSFLNVQAIKSCAAEDFQTQKIHKDLRGNLTSVFREFICLWASLAFWQNLFLGIGFLVIFGFAVSLLRENLISPGKLIMFLGYLSLMQNPFRDLARRWKVFKTGMPAIKRIREILKMEQESYNKEGRTLEKVQGKVEFRNVSFGYKNGQLILRGISFTAMPGQKIAVVGGSGEGKTTLIDLISLYFIPAKGKILLDGIDTTALNLSFLRKIIAYVPQEIILFNDTIKNNILYGKPNAADQEIKKAAEAAYISHFVEKLPQGYNQLVGERGVELSGGQKQRIAIARALIRDPKILILDEATASLDTESERLVQNALEKLIKGRTTFIIAHRLSTVQKADKILVIEKGRIAEQGTHKELIKKKGVYFKFYSLQFSVKR